MDPDSFGTDRGCMCQTEEGDKDGRRKSLRKRRCFFFFLKNESDSYHQGDR